MTISEVELQALNQLITQDQTLLARVQEAATAQELAKIIEQAAHAHGLSVSSEALLSYIENAAKQPPGTELTETQLADVAGGVTLNFINQTPKSEITLFQKSSTPKWPPFEWYTPPQLSWSNEPYTMQIQK